MTQKNDRNTRTYLSAGREGGREGLYQLECVHETDLSHVSLMHAFQPVEALPTGRKISLCVSFVF